MTTTADCYDNCPQIGGMAVRIRTEDSAFLHLLQDRYEGFVGPPECADYEFDVDLSPPGAVGLTRMSFKRSPAFEKWGDAG